MTPTSAVPAYDLAPLVPLLGVGAVLAAGAVAWLRLRRRDTSPASRLRALTVLALFLTFDLVVFGAFTRLTDSGLGCPDWPGCYGSTTPAGAHAAIASAEASLPSGPVTHGKAWIEMTHRYLATGVGALIAWLALRSWIESRRRPGRPDATAVVSPWWATATLAWVCLQGAFGAWTVTWKLYPAIVTAHLLGGIGLLVLLAVQSQRDARAPLALPHRLRRGVAALAVLSVAQIALGGWVSTNYAVLACTDFPSCQGSLWPAMDVARGFTLLRPLGEDGAGGTLTFQALTAIHYVHRLGAYVVLGALAVLAWRLGRQPDPSVRRFAAALAGIAAWQLASGLGNVLLGWPLAAALAHTAGAAMLAVVLAVLATRVWQGRSRPVAVAPALPARAASAALPRPLRGAP